MSLCWASVTFGTYFARHDILQRGPHPSVAEQGGADSPGNSDRRSNYRNISPRRTASPLHLDSDLISDRDRSRRRGGRPRVPSETRQLIRNMSLATRSGAPPGSTANCSSLVSMSARPALQSTWRGGGEGWRSFLCNHADRITSIDLFLDQMLRHDVAPLQ